MSIALSSRSLGARGSIIRELLKKAAQPGMISFGGGSPDPLSFPSQEISRRVRAAFENNSKALLSYGISEGFPDLVASLKAYLADREGICFENNELIILSGGQQCADLTARLLVNEGDRVLVESPSFVGCLNAFRAYGGKLVGVPMDREGMDLNLLEEALQGQRISLLYTIPTFQNPTGFSASLENRRAVYALARRYDVPILEDNPYGELRFEGEKLPSLKSMDVDGRVLYMCSFSKTLAPGLRVGWLVVPKPLFTAFKIAKQSADVHSCTLYQQVCHELLTQWDYEAHLERIRALYQQKCQRMDQEMRDHLHPAITWNKPQGGLFIMMFLPQGMDALPLVDAAARRGVITVPGSAFMADPDAPHNGIRLNYSMPSLDQISQGIRLLGEESYRLLA
jgi:2-aminoadipate transaminase